MNGVIYARYSSDAQREESIEGQLRDCYNYAERSGIIVIAEYIDRAFSAKTDHRPDFQRMIKDAADETFGVVLVWKFDRFARNRYDSVRYKSTLKLHGVEVISVNENITDGAEGVILEAVLEAFAEYYSIDLAKKVARGMTDNVLNGKCNGGSLTFGYTVNPITHKYLIDEERAEYVRKIYEMFLSGISVKNIEIYLRRNNVRNAKGNFISYGGVAHILKNKRYRGDYSFRNVLNENGFPQIISNETFEKVQNLFLSKKRNFSKSISAQTVYALTGLIFCSQCGKQLVGESGTSHTGKIYHYYKCYSVKKGLGCHLRSLRKNDAEKYVFDKVCEKIAEKSIIDIFENSLLKLDSDKSDKVTPLKKELSNLNKKLANLVDFIASGNISKAVKEKILSLETERHDLENLIHREQIIANKEKLDAALIEKWLKEKLPNISDEQKSLLIHIFIEKIIA